jgi:hypothetical protein
MDKGQVKDTVNRIQIGGALLALLAKDPDPKAATAAAAIRGQVLVLAGRLGLTLADLETDKYKETVAAMLAEAPDPPIEEKPPQGSDNGKPPAQVVRLKTLTMGAKIGELGR